MNHLESFGHRPHEAGHTVAGLFSDPVSVVACLYRLNHTAWSRQKGDIGACTVYVGLSRSDGEIEGENGDRCWKQRQKLTFGAAHDNVQTMVRDHHRSVSIPSFRNIPHQPEAVVAAPGTVLSFGPLVCGANLVITTIGFD